MSTPLDIAAVGHQEDEGRVIQLEDAEGQPYDPPATMCVVGTYSQAYRAEEERQGNALLRQRRAKLTGKMVQQQRLERATACILSWEGIVSDGKPVPCTRENATALLASAPWIQEQVEEAMNDHAGFTKSSSKT